tara:strand:+ start:3082 stop:3912 length:831 start_codon:yes stop_codon:yes gene_type:complete
MSESKIYRTNMVSTKDKKLVVAHNNDLMPSRGNFNQWNDSSQNLYQWNGAANSFNIQTKDIDFGNPSRRKKIYKVYVTFKAGGYTSGVIAKYATNGSNTFTEGFDNTLIKGQTDSSFTLYSNTKGFDSFSGSQANSTDDWITVALKPTNSINNVFSFQLKFEFANAGRANFALKDSQINSDNHLELDASASSSNDTYNGQPIYIFAGPGFGLQRRVNDYIGTSRQCNLDSVDDGLEDTDDTNGVILSTNSYYDVGFIPKEFAINDITIIYREKNIR